MFREFLNTGARILSQVNRVLRRSTDVGRNFLTSEIWRKNHTSGCLVIVNRHQTEETLHRCGGGRSMLGSAPMIAGGSCAPGERFESREAAPAHAFPDPDIRNSVMPRAGRYGWRRPRIRPDEQGDGGPRRRRTQGVLLPAAIGRMISPSGPISVLQGGGRCILPSTHSSTT